MSKNLKKQRVSYSFSAHNQQWETVSNKAIPYCYVLSLFRKHNHIYISTLSACSAYAYYVGVGVCCGGYRIKGMEVDLVVKRSRGLNSNRVIGERWAVDAENT